jgi:N,N'-diacetyllegionaminate synthase
MSVLIIGEIGVNHGGNYYTAFDMIGDAKHVGVDVVKFQMYDAAKLAKDSATYEMLCRLSLPRAAHKELAQECKRQNIGYACTGFDADSLDWLLDNTDMDFVKIPSGQAGNLDLLKMAEISGKMVIQSIKEDTSLFKFNGENWKYLWVVPEYPTPPEHAQLREVSSYDGISDHSGEIFVPLAAVALGAKIVECHFTMDKDLEGPDHKASLTPTQFTDLVRGIRIIEKAMA